MGLKQHCSMRKLHLDKKNKKKSVVLKEFAIDILKIDECLVNFSENIQGGVQIDCKFAKTESTTDTFFGFFRSFLGHYSAKMLLEHFIFHYLYRSAVQSFFLCISN